MCTLQPAFRCLPWQDAQQQLQAAQATIAGQKADQTDASAVAAVLQAQLSAITLECQTAHFFKKNILFRIFINGKYYASNSFGWVFFPPGRSGRIPIMVRSEVSYVCLLLATASIAQCSCCSFVFVVPQKLLPLSPERVIQRTHWFYLEVVSQQDRVQSPETGWRQGLRSKCTEAENRAKVGIHPCSHYCTNYPPLLNKTPL